jgi:hypothetical protein
VCQRRAAGCQQEAAVCQQEAAVCHQEADMCQQEAAVCQHVSTRYLQCDGYVPASGCYTVGTNKGLGISKGCCLFASKGVAGF